MGGTVIIDPPWPYDGVSSDRRLRGYSAREYKPMTPDALAALPVAKMADYVFLWTTKPFCEDAFRLIRKWGYEPVTMMFWIKVEKVFPARETNPVGFVPGYGVGYWVRGTTEPIIVGKRPKAPSIRSQYLDLMSPNAHYSRKPQSLHTLIEELYPKPHIELFARKERKGWVCLGDELQDKSIELSIRDYLN